MRWLVLVYWLVQGPGLGRALGLRLACRPGLALLLVLSMLVRTVGPAWLGVRRPCGGNWRVLTSGQPCAGRPWARPSRDMAMWLGGRRGWRRRPPERQSGALGAARRRPSALAGIAPAPARGVEVDDVEVDDREAKAGRVWLARLRTPAGPTSGGRSPQAPIWPDRYAHFARHSLGAEVRWVTLALLAVRG